MLFVLFPGMYGMGFNRHDSLREHGDQSSKLISSDFPPNTHGNKPFVAKYQLGGFIKVYDQKRTFDLYCSPKQDPEGYDALATLIRQGPMGLKNYLWTRRVAEDKVEVCLDILPKDGLNW